MDNQNLNQLIPENSQISPTVPKPKSKKKIWFILGILGMVIIALAVYFAVPKLEQEVIDEVVEDVDEFIGEFASKFSTYEEVAVNISPNVPAYTVNSDLSNVVNAKDHYYYDFSPSKFSNEAKNLLTKNAFVVNPTNYNEFFPLYESNRYHYIPNFITTDSMLHNYHLMFDFLLKNLEEEKLAEELKKLSANMLAEAINQYNNLKGTEWENAAKRNVGFFAVGSKLLDTSTNIPSFVKNEVERELSLMESHQGVSESPVMNIGASGDTLYTSPQGILRLESLKEDYSQYIPRGHYDQSEQLKAYFKSMLWYGRLTFRLKSEDEIKSGILITIALNQGNNQARWNKIYEPINFFVGKSDDITYYQFKDLIEKVYGENVTSQLVASDKDKFNSFVEETEILEPPKLNSIPVFNEEIQPDLEKEIKGFRFMGQRFTVDAEIFQRLIDREVSGRMLPNGLDIPAAFGSDEALNILTEAGETEYKNYSENMTQMRSYISGLPVETWTQNLYWGWLYQLRPLLEEKGDGYPSFMQNNAWLRKDLNTFLGSWSELKHDTILYSKQTFAELGGGGNPPPPPDDRGYVEPNPYVYARLASLLKMTSEGLESRDLLTERMKENLSRLEQLAMSFKVISEKELNNETLTDEEYELIRSYGGQLEHFWIEVNRDEPAFKATPSQMDYLNENPAAIIADVATDPNGKVLEVGTGKISEIYVIVPVDGKLTIAVGGVYSYYEFTWPMSDRLTDKKWRELLKTDQAPALPSWTDTFVAE